eukprot:444224-Hanusia_phi.AAC.1
MAGGLGQGRREVAKVIQTRARGANRRNRRTAFKTRFSLGWFKEPSGGLRGRVAGARGLEVTEGDLVTPSDHPITVMICRRTAG